MSLDEQTKRKIREWEIKIDKSHHSLHIMIYQNEITNLLLKHIAEKGRG